MTTQENAISPLRKAEAERKLETTPKHIRCNRGKLLLKELKSGYGPLTISKDDFTDILIATGFTNHGSLIKGILLRDVKCKVSVDVFEREDRCRFDAKDVFKFVADRKGITIPPKKKIKYVYQTLAGPTKVVYSGEVFSQNSLTVGPLSKEVISFYQDQAQNNSVSMQTYVTKFITWYATTVKDKENL